MDDLARFNKDRWEELSREEVGFSAVPAVPDRSHRVHDPTRPKVETGCDDGVTGRAVADLGTGAIKLGARGREDRSTDACSTAQLVVGRVDDGVDPLGRDVAASHLDAHIRIVAPLGWSRPPIRSRTGQPTSGTGRR